MLVTKFYLGFSLLFLGTYFLDTRSEENYLFSGKHPTLIGKTEHTLTVAKNAQMPGKEIYDDFCIQCHGANGKGDGINFPPLDGSDWLTKKRTKSIHAVKYGQTGEIVVNGKKFNNVMQPMGLSNKEIADVMNYIMNSWSNKKMKAVTEKEVESVAK